MHDSIGGFSRSGALYICHLEAKTFCLFSPSSVAPPSVIAVNIVVFIRPFNVNFFTFLSIFRIFSYKRNADEIRVMVCMTSRS